ncbi:MAG: hypothetical protein KKB59_20100 [Spirochaetes bacterium]|nr:hypothetical protein [Spirochaetota bacterium]
MDGEVLKWGAIIAGIGIGGYIGYKILGKAGLLKIENPRGLSQAIDTRGGQHLSNPRTTYFLGNGGSVSELQRLPEDHGRGEAVNPEWRRWEGTFGGIRQEPTGTFNDMFTEEARVTPQLEAYLAESVRNKLWEQGGTQPPTGTFG